MARVKKISRDALLGLTDPAAWSDDSTLVDILSVSGVTGGELLALLKSPDYCAEFCDAVLDHLTLYLPGVVRAVLHKALTGDVPAAKFLMDVLWRRVGDEETRRDSEITVQWEPRPPHPAPAPSDAPARAGQARS